MRLGLSLAITQPRSGSVFDPGTLDLTGWWRNFSVVPWSGTASAGISGVEEMQTNASDPSVGSLNGHGIADFNGTANTLLSENTAASYITSTNLSGWAVVNIDAVDTDNPSEVFNDTIIGTTGTSRWFIYLRNNAGTVTVHHTLFTGASQPSIPTGITLGVWQLVQWRANGTVIEIRVNGGAWASTTGGTIDALTAKLEMGHLIGFFDGKIAEIGLSKQFLSDTTFNSIRAYASSYHGQSF